GQFTSTWTTPGVNGRDYDFYFQSTGTNGWVEVAGPNVVAAGTITGVTARAGMSGGGTSGNVTLTAGSAAVTGAVKSNGAGTYSHAACADLTGAAPSCSTDATNAANI